MSWVFLDDRFFTNRKVMSVSLHARWLYLSALCVASQQGTDGKLPDTAQDCLMVAVGRSASFDALAGELVTAGLWIKDKRGAYEIHNYLEYQPSADEQRHQRAKNADRLKRWRRKRNERREDGADETHETLFRAPFGTSSETLPRPVPSRIVKDKDKDPESKPIAGEPSLPLAAQTSLLPGEPSVVRQTRAKKPRAESKTGDTWTAYAESYARRYGEPPLRNAKINGQLAQLVAQMGADSPGIAAHYLASASAYYVTSGHSVGLLLRDCQKLRTEMQTGQRINAETARRNENAEANPFAQELLSRMKARKEAEQNGK